MNRQLSANIDFAFAACAIGVATVTCPVSAAADAPPAATPPAATPPAATPPPTTSPPDVVRLKSGAMFRGTISQMEPQGDVVIVLMTGETRTFPMADVDYAGEASKAPKEEPAKRKEARKPEREAHDATSPRPMVTVHGTDAQVHFTADQPEVTLHWRSATAVGTGGSAAGYERVCSAPCDATVPAGTYTLALSEGNGGPVESSKPVHLQSGENEVRGKYESNAVVRGIGWAGFAGGLLLGLALASGEDAGDSGSSSVPYVVMAGSLLFIPLTLMGDDAEIKVGGWAGADEAGSAASSLGFRQELSVDRWSPLRQRGMSVRLTF